MRYDLKVINNMVCETFNGKIINENTFDVINNNESCFIHKSNDKNKADIIIKLIKVSNLFNLFFCDLAIKWKVSAAVPSAKWEVTKESSNFNSISEIFRICVTQFQNKFI